MAAKLYDETQAMNRLVLLLLAAMTLAVQGAVQPSYQQSWSAGVTDTNGNLLYGTETIDRKSVV